MSRGTRNTGRAAAALLLTLAAACGDGTADAYGNFEATEVVVSAEVGGRLLRLDVEAGRRVAAGEAVGRVDTVPLALRRDELVAQRGASATRTGEAEAQVAVLRAQLATAEEELARTRRLFGAEAATARQLNLAEGEVRVLRERIEAARVATGAAREEVGGVEARLAQLDDQVARSRIVSPAAGTVLATYAEAGELVQAGQPLFRVAPLDTLTLRAYVSGAQLARVRLGQAVRVRTDAPDGTLATHPGRVVRIAAEAEFTPTPIQTREERTDQVYAVEIRVPNPDGALRIGMPAEVVLPAAEGGRTASRARP